MLCRGRASRGQGQGQGRTTEVKARPRPRTACGDCPRTRPRTRPRLIIRGQGRTGVGEKSVANLSIPTIITYYFDQNFVKFSVHVLSLTRGSEDRPPRAKDIGQGTDLGLRTRPRTRPSSSRRGQGHTFCPRGRP